MATNITIATGELTLAAELDDSDTAAAFAATLPATISLSRWGDEYYGACGVTAEPAADARDVLEIGELAYWPPGRALCLSASTVDDSRGD